MDRTVETLSGLGQGQRVRLTLADERAIEMRVNQMEHVPGDCLRLELTTDESGDNGRYRVDVTVADGAWTTPAFRRYDRVQGAWQPLEGVRDVTPLEMFRTVKSTDMEAQAGTGSGK